MNLLERDRCDVQSPAGTRVCAMKNKVGFFLPTAVESSFDEMAGELVSGKEKWLVISAAILLMLELSPEERGTLIRRVRAESGKDGDFGRLVAEAKAMSGGTQKQPREAPAILLPGQALKRQPKRGQSPPPAPAPASKGQGRGPAK